uniref:Neural retina-specific leucine zipper protein n=1 Tax=Panagrellus redivivus TaxID=6233 RepID=A0A7E4WA94_PANRE
MSSPSLSPASSKSPTSPASSESAGSSRSSQLNLQGVPELSDEELAQLSVRQLNMKLQGQDRKIVTELKQKRRTLKNRGYALNCRVRRVQNQMQLEADIVMLRNQVHHLTETLRQMQARLQYYEPAGTPPPIPTAPQTASSSYYNFSQGFTTQ